MQIGDAVIYVDEFGESFDALLTAVHGKYDPDAAVKPSVNVIYVSPNEGEHDQYGRQIRRQSSVAHHAPPATAHGRYYQTL
jgi:hypothetical protein